MPALAGDVNRRVGTSLDSAIGVDPPMADFSEAVEIAAAAAKALILAAEIAAAAAKVTTFSDAPGRLDPDPGAKPKLIFPVFGLGVVYGVPRVGGVYPPPLPPLKP